MEGKKRTQTKKIGPTRNTPRNPQPPGDRDQFETTCEETRPTRYPTLARSHRSRVCENMPCTAFSINQTDECYTHARHRQTNYIMAPCTHPGMKRHFCLKVKRRPRSLRVLGLALLLVERYLRQRCLVPVVARVRLKQRKQKKRKEIPPDTKKTCHETYPQQSGDRDHLGANKLPLFYWYVCPSVWVCTCNIRRFY